MMQVVSIPGEFSIDLVIPFILVSSLFNLQLIQRILIVFMPQKYQPDYKFLRHVPLIKVHLYTGVQIISLAALWAVKSISSISIVFPLMVGKFILQLSIARANDASMKIAKKNQPTQTILKNKKNQNPKKLGDVYLMYTRISLLIECITITIQKQTNVFSKICIRTITSEIHDVFCETYHNAERHTLKKKLEKIDGQLSFKLKHSFLFLLVFFCNVWEQQNAVSLNINFMCLKLEAMTIQICAWYITRNFFSLF